MSELPEDFLLRAATIDEVLEGSFEPHAGQKADTDRAALRLAAWCRACASGDWAMFARRLKREGLSIETVLARFAQVRFPDEFPLPQWASDAKWVFATLVDRNRDAPDCIRDPRRPLPFEGIFLTLAARAEALVDDEISADVRRHFSQSARRDLRHALLSQLTNLAAPIIYNRFVESLRTASAHESVLPSSEDVSTHLFEKFLSELDSGGLHSIFEEVPVLLRLISVITRQWIEANVEFMTRLASDYVDIRNVFANVAEAAVVEAVSDHLSDLHNFGRCVRIIAFDDGLRVVYKPKDLRTDTACHRLVERLNASHPPISLRAAKVLARDGYGWTEFIEHTSCAGPRDFEMFFSRAGAWLALLHVLCAEDMHFENIIASGSHPVPIDLETILQPTSFRPDLETAATAATLRASRQVADTVLAVGMLPTYERGLDRNIFDVSGMNEATGAKTIGGWKNINTNGMRRILKKIQIKRSENLPYTADGASANFGNYLDVFTDSFVNYSRFLIQQQENFSSTNLLADFAHLTVRKIIRPTRFYHLLQQRLKDYRSMEDGITWSAQADFLARLADWDSETDILWPLQQAERLALLNLNIPHFVCADGSASILDTSGHSVKIGETSGFSRSVDRLGVLNEAEIKWQSQVIRISTSFIEKPVRKSPHAQPRSQSLSQIQGEIINDRFLKANVEHIYGILERAAFIEQESAAWIGLDWVGNSGVAQLVTLGHDLYGGTAGIGLFLSAYARLTGDATARALALRSLAALRLQLRQPSAARWARGIGTGGATGLGSIVYALTSISEILDDESLLVDAEAAGALFTAELVRSDEALDCLDGTAGAILGLLRLHRKTGSASVIERAIKCGDHLLSLPRIGAIGARSWSGLGSRRRPMTGIAHGASGFSLALSRLAGASGRADFADAARECVGYERSCYDPVRHNWPYFGKDERQDTWLCQWCHGAIGIGMARIATLHEAGSDRISRISEIESAVIAAELNWPQAMDTLCCGTLGTIEFLTEAGKVLGRSDLLQTSNRFLKQVIEARLKKEEYHWGEGQVGFNPGLFRGISGVGFTLARNLDGTLPNILIWE